MTPQAAAKELESVMKRVREAQSTIAAAIEPGIEFNDMLKQQNNTLLIHSFAERALPISVGARRRSSSRSRRPRRSRSCSHSRIRQKRSLSKHRYTDVGVLFLIFSKIRGSFSHNCHAGLGLTPTVPDVSTGGALTPETRDAVWAGQGVSNSTGLSKTSRSYIWLRNMKVHVIRYVII